MANLTMSSTSDSDMRKFERLQRKVKVCIALTQLITNKDISASSKADTIKLVSYDLKKLEAMSVDLKDFEKQQRKF